MITIFLFLFANNRNIVTFVSVFNSDFMTKKVKEVISLLESEGWEFVRMKGDHRVYQKKGAARPIIVPGKLSADLAEGTYHSILRGMGLK